MTPLRALKRFNYRIWAAGALVSNIGTWMQRTAQDWLVLAELTDHNATAVGIVMSLQFGPQLLLLPWTGYAADRFDRRRLLMVTQALMGGLALGLGLLTVFGLVRLWEVYVFALLTGCVTAFDAPARQTFVGDLVGDVDLSNAVALNSTSFNLARMMGPALAGSSVALVGSGWSFIANGASFGAVLISLMFLRPGELTARLRARKGGGGLTEGFRYVWGRPDLKTQLVMLFLIGTFGLNFQIFISTMTVTVFHQGADRYGLLTSVMAVGTTIGAFCAAAWERPAFRLLPAAAAMFGLGCMLAALAPGSITFGLMLIVIGISALIFSNATNSLMQLSSEPVMRGRVMAIRLAVALGCTPLGAPLVGWVADHFGPRWALAVGAASGFAAAAVAIAYLARQKAESPAPAGEDAR